MNLDHQPASQLNSQRKSPTLNISLRGFKFYKIALILFIYLIASDQLLAQKNKNQIHRTRVGLNYGQASQENFPLNNSNYSYENKYLKVQLNYLLYKKRKFGIELHIEPSIYKSNYQLLNKYFIQPNSGTDYLEKRELYTCERSFNEYAFNIGIITRFAIFKALSTYAMVSTGPMISEKDTERLRKGLAFSDIFGIGLSYVIRKFILDARITFRHNSNANLYQPNCGHNSIGFETGISFQFVEEFNKQSQN